MICLSEKTILRSAINAVMKESSASLSIKAVACMTAGCYAG